MTSPSVTVYYEATRRLKRKENSYKGKKKILAETWTRVDFENCGINDSIDCRLIKILEPV
jgi:hypothetical protein